jgi:protein-tyrosine phosphatase
VVNCTTNLPFFCKSKPGWRVPIKDNLEQVECNKLLMMLPKTVEIIARVLQKGSTVLVHCQMGMQRSAAVVAAYLMWRYGLSMDVAMQIVKQRRPVAFFIRANFLTTLERWGAETGGGGAVHHAQVQPRVP